MKINEKTNINSINSPKDMLIGCLLGDAHIGIVESNKCFITFEQTIKHSSYISHIYEILKNFNIAVQDIKHYSIKDLIYNSLNKSVYLKTYNLESLYPFAEMFLLNNKKIVPLNISECLTPKALAYWICDDGQLVKKGGITLCTDNYSLT